VPFDFIAAPPEQWWMTDSRGGIDVALGRVGATKRQHLRLGKGPAQHALIAGKTGSGKSTLLHALITNLALLYSPEEVELYLIDFKKGVEFKTYAAHELPHARVVAIESDREFGLSVLQRLDAELKARGERFRETGAQDLKGYHEANGLVEGNNPFQVVWLPEQRREAFLQSVRELDQKRTTSAANRVQIVFEGNAPADIRKNPLLHDLVSAPAWPAAPQAFQAWLGEAMAIKDPTAAIFRRQSGSNLLLVGQQEEAALGILATALLSL